MNESHAKPLSQIVHAQRVSTYVIDTILNFVVKRTRKKSMLSKGGEKNNERR